MIHPGHREPLRRALALLAALALGLVLAWALPTPAALRGIAGYVPLHTLLETIAIVIAMLVFAVGWHASSRDVPRNVVLLACAFVGVALLDFSHALSFAGMPDYVTPSDPEKAINFWLTARLLAALALLATALAPWRPFSASAVRYGLLSGVLAVVTVLHVLFLFRPGDMPRTFVAGSGLTAFKIGSEAVLVLLNLAAAAVLLRRMRMPLPFNAAALFAAVCTMALSELFFMLYASVTDLFNLLGHLYKVVAYLFLYRAIFIDSVERPYHQLRTAQAQLRSTLQTIPDPFWLKDRQGVYLDCNPALERLLGRPREAIVGRRDDTIFAPELAASFRAVDRRVMDAGEPCIEEHAIDRDGGEAGRFEVVKTAMRDASGGVAGVLGIARDITAARRDQEALRVSEQRLQQLNASLEERVLARTRELAQRNDELAASNRRADEVNRELEAALAGLRLAQDELVRSEKMASLGSLVAGVAHELNTPIGNAVMVASTLADRQREFEAGMAAGLRRSGLDAFLAATREVAEVLERNLQRAAELIGSFKQIAVDQSSYQRRPFALDEIVQEVAVTLRPTLRRAGVVLVDHTPPGLDMDSYPGPLAQVFINLVNNAVQHAFEGRNGGRVRIEASPVGSERVALVVGDDGRGIEPQHLKQVFDPFFTTRLGHGGSGLGLHIAYTLVNGLLGGRIDVRSLPGQGTEFLIELPRVAPVAVARTT